MKEDRKIAASLLIMSVLSACSPMARHNTLSFFFDGVPGTDTNEIYVGIPEQIILPEHDTSLEIRRTTYTYHQPYREKQCVACHEENAVGSIVKEEPELCYMCHQDFKTQYESLHGPVDAGFCSSCHDPHMSLGKDLLISQGNTLCKLCHLNEEVRQPLEHADIAEALCITCHDPHARKVFRKKPKPIPLER